MMLRRVCKVGILILSCWAVAAWPRPPWAAAAAASAAGSDTTTSTATTGDDRAECADAAASARVVLQDFVRRQAPDVGNFKIQGWRWHTMSLIREATRLERYLTHKWRQPPPPQRRNSDETLEEEEEVATATRTVVDYVVDFNMRGLHRIQDDLFFPWVREQVRERAGDEEAAVASAFDTIMDELEDQRQQLERLGKVLVSRNVPVAT